MPVIKVQHVVSCSSEDRVHNAENMLVSDHYRKWKSAQPGEKQITILLRLEKSSAIHSIDIGNECSAFVEVLVGRSSDSKQEFQVLLVSSSFMTPTESRQNSNTNRVRMFGPDKLSQAVSKEKWDLVKIVCTQPFNKTTQYGLSFIVFHSPPEKNEDIDPQPNQQISLGAFKIKSSAESESNISVGSWFAKRKSDSQDVDMQNTPSAIKAATVKRPENSLLISSTKKRKISNGDCDNSIQSTSNGFVTASRNTDRERNKQSQEPKTFALSETPKTNTPRVDLSSAKTTSRSDPTTPKPSTSRADPTSSVSKFQSKMNSNKLETKSQSPAQSNKHTKKRSNPDIPFHKLLDGTVFALSGYQNPKRGQIRDRAIEMGAVYRPDWDRQCTHLVCAFLNTPKFQQVHSKGGRIVKESWILECYKQKKRLPWRQFMLGKSNRPETSESEVSDSEDRRNDNPKGPPAKTTPVSKPTQKGTSNPETSEMDSSEDDDRNKNTPRPKPIKPFKTVTSDKSGSYRSTSSPSKLPSKVPVSVDDELNSDDMYKADTEADSDSGCDTETEISKVVAKENSRHKDIKRNVDTSNLDLPQLPNIFQGEHFFMIGDFSAAEKRALTRYIVGCGGVIEEYMNNKVLYVLSNSKWNQEFTDAISDNSSLRILRPSWVSDSVDQGSLLPKKDYFVPKR